MPSYTFYMQEDGKLPASIRQTMVNVCPTFAGQKVRLSIAEAKDKRSLDQNSFLHGVVIPHVRMARLDMGDPITLDQCHEDLLAQFAPTVTAKRLDGSIYARPMRSKEMNVEQMALYLTAIQGFMGEMGYPIKEREFA